MRCALLVWSVLLAGLVSAAHAQTPPSTPSSCPDAPRPAEFHELILGGLILDPTGRFGAEGVSVVIENEVTGQRWERTTDIAGLYRVRDVQPGCYRVSIGPGPFDGVTQHVIVPADPSQADPRSLKVFRPTATLFIGARDIVLVLRAQERLTVERQPLAVPLIHSDGSVGDVFSHEAFAAMVTSGHTLQALQAVVPGIVVTESVGSLAQFTAAGQRRYANRLTIDGIEADLAVDARGRGIGEAGSGALPAVSTIGSTETLVSFAAIEEMQIRTTNTSSEYARTPGAQTTVVTRAGGDRFSGSAFLDAQVPGWSAADWFANARGASPHRVGDTEVGASAGGPVRPGRIFYFVSWEHQALDRSRFVSVPTPGAAVRAEAPPFAQALFDAFPQPNGPDLGGSLSLFSQQIPIQSRLSTLSVRGDANLSTRHRLFVRVNDGGSSGDWTDEAQQPASAFTNTEETSTKTLTGGVTSVLSSFTNELRANVSRYRGSLTAGPASYGGARPVPSGILAPIAASRDNTWTSVTLFPGPGGTLVSGRSGASTLDQVQLVDTWTALLARHEWRFGADYRRLTAEDASAPDRYRYQFNSPSELLGDGGLVLFEHQAPSRARLTSWSLFAEDAWRLASRLSVNYGVRYAVTPAPHSLTDTQPLLFDAGALPALQPLPAGQTMWRTAWRNLAPRVAATYRLDTAGERETVVRAGWSLAFDELTPPGAAAIGGGYPFAWSRTIPSSVFPVPAEQLIVSAPASFAGADGAEAYAFPRALRTPRSYQWQIGIDRALGFKQGLSLAYAGAAGRDLTYWYASYPTGDPAHAINAYSNDGRSDYHALLVEYVRRLSGGFQARAAYTWSHVIDLDSGESIVPNPPPQVVAPATNRGSADFDRRHVLHVTASYDLPAPPFTSWTRALFSDWQLAVVGTMLSGAPFSVTTTRDLDGGVYTLRTDLQPGVPAWRADATSPTGRSLDPAAFPIPTASRQGTLGRNALHASALHQVDLALTRSLHFGIRTQAQIRATAFNVLNRPNVGPPIADLSRAGFGQAFQTYAEALGTGTLTGGGLVPIEQIGGPRAVQVSLRLAW